MARFRCAARVKEREGEKACWVAGSAYKMELYDAIVDWENEVSESLGADEVYFMVVLDLPYL